MVVIAPKDLDPAAVKEANWELWRQHPELNHRPLTMGSRDLALRQEWMVYYQDAAKARQQGATTTVPEEEAEANSPVQDKEVGQTQQKCPKAFKLKVTRPPSNPSIPCSVLEASATCQHGARTVTHEGVLEVVPDYDILGDEIALKSTMQPGSCSRHPTWQVSGYWTSSLQGPVQSFKARSWKYRPGHISPWIPRISPHMYAVSVAGCDGGGAHRMEVRAYPNDKISIEIDFKKILEKFMEVKDSVQSVLEVFVPKCEFKFLEGKVKFSSGWEEYTDHRAYYAYDISIGFNPLIGFEINMPLATAFPGVPTELMECALYLKLFGGLNITAHYRRSSPDFATGNGATSGSGNVGGGLEGKVSAGGGKILALSISGTTEMSIGAKGLVDDGGWGLQDIKLQWGGVKATFEVSALWGIIKVTKEAQLIDSQTLWHKDKKYIWRSDDTADD